MKRDDHHLVQQVLDGDIDREGFDDFQKRLRAEPELAELYTGYAVLDHTLSEEFESGTSTLAAAGSARGVFGIPRWLIAAAAVLAMAAAGWWMAGRVAKRLPGEAAVISFSLDAVWEIDGKTKARGAATAVAKDSTLHLRQGRAVVSLKPSANAVIEGPAELRVLSQESLFMSHGRGFFDLGQIEGNLTVTTPRLSASDAGTRFGIEVPAQGPDELHVLSGMLRVVSLETGETTAVAGGGAVRVPGQGEIERFPIDGRHFASGLGRFLPVVSGPFDKTVWRVAYGQPSITGNRIDGTNYSAFLQLPAATPTEDGGIVLVTLETGTPAEGSFHSDGWAGMSFYHEKSEVIFIGDPFGTEGTWAMDVKQEKPLIILPDPPVSGPRTVTLRYDSHSGAVSLHDGTPPLAAPFCVGEIPPGTRFDEIRLGASAGAALAVNRLLIRVSEE